MVSVCIIARNEGKVIQSLFENMKSQDYSHKDMEIVLIDSMSTDNTKALMQQFADESEKNGFACVNVYENKKMIQSAGWNVAIEKAQGDIIIRVDAHTMIPSEFVRKSVACIESGECVCGGARPNIAVPRTKWTDVLLATESSMFGSGIAIYRRKKDKKRYVECVCGGARPNIAVPRTKWTDVLLATESSMFGSGIAIYRRKKDKKRYVNSVFHGAYRKEVFEKVGGFNEKLGRTEDNEMHYRIREAGYRICYDPEIISYQHIRSTWRGMIKQKYSNGYWIGLTLGVCPKCLAVYHFIPFFFVLSLIVGVILGETVSWMPFLLLFMVYGIFCMGNTVLMLLHHKNNLYFLFSPFIFLSLHVMYGLGTMVGIIRMPIWRKKIYYR